MRRKKVGFFIENRYKEKDFSKYSSKKYNHTIGINFLKYIHPHEMHILLLLFLHIQSCSAVLLNWFLCN